MRLYQALEIANHGKKKIRVLMKSYKETNYLVLIF